MFSITTDSKWIKGVKIAVYIYSICLVIAGILLGVALDEEWLIIAMPLACVIAAVITFVCGMALCEFLYNVHFMVQKMNKAAIHSEPEVNSDELPEL